MAKEPTSPVHTRLPKRLIQRVDAVAKRGTRTRSMQLTRWILEGLERDERDPTRYD